MQIKAKGVFLFAGESESFIIAHGALVDIALAIGQVLKMLDGKTSVVGNPAGAAEVVASHTLLRLGIAQAGLALIPTFAALPAVVVDVIAGVVFVYGCVHTVVHYIE